jgi:hypothetical protein
VPEFWEQEELVKYLDRETLRIDSLASKVDQSIGKLQEYRAAVISAAITGKIDVRNEAD